VGAQKALIGAPDDRELISLRCESVSPGFVRFDGRGLLQRLIADIVFLQRSISYFTTREKHTHGGERRRRLSLLPLEWASPRSLLRRQTDHRFLRPPADLITHFFALWLRVALHISDDFQRIRPRTMKVSCERRSPSACAAATMGIFQHERGCKNVYGCAQFCGALALLLFIRRAAMRLALWHF
jgi:hypothetical protein